MYIIVVMDQQHHHQANVISKNEHGWKSSGWPNIGVLIAPAQFTNQWLATLQISAHFFFVVVTQQFSQKICGWSWWWLAAVSLDYLALVACAAALAACAHVWCVCECRRQMELRSNASRIHSVCALQPGMRSIHHRCNDQWPLQQIVAHRKCAHIFWFSCLLRSMGMM